MTPEELENLICHGTADSLIDALAPLDEPSRKKLGATAARLLRSARRTRAQAWQSATDKLTAEMQQMAELAVLGLCSWTEARRATPAFFRDSYKGKEGPVCRILRLRRPEWIDKWVEQQLEGRWCDWATIRRLVRHGACRRPSGDNYIRWMIRNHATDLGYLDTPLADVLRADPGLLQDEIWQMFETDLGRQAVFSGELYAPPTWSWQTALVALARDGDIDRQRLLSASLKGITCQTQPANATWFCRLHEALEPTLQECEARQSSHCDLLSSAVPAVVAFALGLLKRLAQAGKISVEAFAASVGPVFDLRQKTHPAVAVQILRLVARREPSSAVRICTEAARGLSHPAPDVQKASVDLIESLATEPSAELAEAITQRLESVAPSQRPRVTAILATVGNGNQRSAVASPVTVPAGVQQAVPEDDFSKIGLPWRALAGIDACLEARASGAALRAIQGDSMVVPRLEPSAKLTPILDLDTLIERASAAIERLEEADELELVLDAMSRLADQRPDDFEARVAPLLKRAGDVLKNGSTGGHIHAQFVVLTQSWLQKRFTSMPRGRPGWLPPLEFVCMRFVRLSARLATLKAGPLLACPTHKGGWLDPRELVRRLQVWQEWASHRGTPGGLIGEHALPDVFDLIQALLRLAPEHRQEALVSASCLQGQAGQAVRYALGADEPIGKHPGLWIAAVRARNPNASVEAFAQVHGDLGPDAAYPATRKWDLRKSPYSHQNWQLLVETLPTLSREQCMIDRPLALLNHHPPADYIMTPVLDIRCRLAIWPPNSDPNFADGAMLMASRLDDGASNFSPLAPFLDPLFDPAASFSEMAQLMVAIALLVKDPGAKGMAIDALIALIQDGRCVGDELGPIYAKLSVHKGMVRLNRLAEPLAQIARVSALHQHAAIRIVQSLLASLTPPVPDDLYHVLTPLREWLVETGEPLGEKARATLESVKGSGKSAKLAGALLSLSPADPSRHRACVYAQALHGRIERAHTWMQRVSTSSSGF